MSSPRIANLLYGCAGAADGLRLARSAHRRHASLGAEQGSSRWAGLNGQGVLPAEDQAALDGLVERNLAGQRP